MTEQEFAELSAAAALRALSTEETERFRATLAAHPEWQYIADADAEAAGMLADLASPVEPPAAIRGALLAQIAAPAPGPHEADGSGEPVALAPKRSRRLRLAFSLAASVALLVGVGLGTAALSGVFTPPASVVALQEIQAAADAQSVAVELESGGTATAHWSLSVGTAVLVTDGIAVLPEDEDYELWFVRGSTPIAAGVFAVDSGDATVQLSGDMHAGDVIAVTIEQAGGSPDGTPTSDPVIVIPTT